MLFTIGVMCEGIKGASRRVQYTKEERKELERQDKKMVEHNSQQETNVRYSHNVQHGPRAGDYYDYSQQLQIQRSDSKRVKEMRAAKKNGTDAPNPYKEETVVIETKYRCN